MTDARISRLEREVDALTEALSHAWDQLVPLLRDTPAEAETPADIVPTLSSILYALDAQYGAVYLAERGDAPAAWYATPSHALSLTSFLPLRAELTERRAPTSLLSVSPYSGETGSWWFTPLWVDGSLAGAIGVGFEGKRSELSAAELRLLVRMSERAAGTLLAAQLQESRAREAQTAHELQIAAMIQRSILPQRFPHLEGVTLAAYWQPAAIVAGDAWGWVVQPDGALAGFVLDIAGKGLPSSLWASSLRSALNIALRLGLSPAEVINVVNAEVYDGFTAAGLIATVTVWRYTPATQIFEQASAGHPATLIRRAGAWSALPARVPPIGVFAEIRPHPQTDGLQPGDLVLCFSDGLTELETSAGLWGEQGIRQAADTVKEGSVQAVVDAIMTAAGAARLTTEPIDDITLVVLQIPAQKGATNPV